jgi:hypothetical protein
MWRSFKLMLISAIMHFLCIVVSMFGSIFYNIAGIINSDLTQQLFILNIFMLTLGIVNMVLAIGFILYFRFKVLAVHRSVTPVASRAESTVAPVQVIDHSLDNHHFNRPVDHDINGSYGLNPYYTPKSGEFNHGVHDELELPPEYDAIKSNPRYV